ncbi:hypothetical protein A1O3_08788 [Capronia epimyces CBS 606.96]|uniref:NAD(P)-binding domain-containing protein n=1 Tax=Capronia epimyces CBS 606.96 TaxID=1182542 RepID=W9XQN1_9EURO|nr:uncharacterized protein A1O3_08788 [Capronia epimyces CBS 606.96]EXJ79286.1 hypothetical protein A1O3_08788 [Capronia epimyces CBS 606.96]
MTTTASKVFIIGPGLIGWNILDQLVAEGYQVTALTRREQQASEIRQSGATAVMGTLADVELIREHSAASDIVIQCATGDDLALAQAVLDGARLRARAGLSSIYLHTSGAKVFDDGAKGMFCSERVYLDSVRGDMDSVGPDAPHRHVDAALVAAEEDASLRSHLRLAIVLPPEVYGYDDRHGRLSMTIPKLTRFALKHGYVPVIGKGLAVETNVHYRDLVGGYVAILHFLEQQQQEQEQQSIDTNTNTNTTNPYWLCENGDGTEFAWIDAATIIARALHQAGRIADPRPRQPPEQLYGELCGDRTESYLGLNCRARAVRLRQLGWEPREKKIWESYLDDELPVLLRE